eukprot:NODE_737_length_4687_cov_0.414778.p2 type:complete len:261 gc:universal NODE_737_length_4687_cov_0.414778:2966-2184(-)
MTMLFGTLATALVSPKKLEFKPFVNVSFHELSSIAVSGDLTCAIHGPTAQIYCWNTSDPSAVPYLKKTGYLFHSISIDGSRACASQLFNKVYCTKNFKAESVDWILAYDKTDAHTLTVELDGNTACILNENSVKCADFSTILSGKQLWKEKKVPGGRISDISISGELACLSYYDDGKPMCTKNIRVDSPYWVTLDMPIEFVRIYKDKKCGVHKYTNLITCYQGGKWIDQTVNHSVFALDNTHIVNFDYATYTLSAAEFPK